MHIIEALEARDTSRAETLVRDHALGLADHVAKPARIIPPAEMIEPRFFVHALGQLQEEDQVVGTQVELLLGPAEVKTAKTAPAGLIPCGDLLFDEQGGWVFQVACDRVAKRGAGSPVEYAMIEGKR